MPIEIGHVGDAGVLITIDPQCGKTNPDGSTNVATLAGLTLTIVFTHYVTGLRRVFNATASTDNLKMQYTRTPGDLPLDGDWDYQPVGMNGPNIIFKGDVQRVTVGAAL